MWPPQASGPGKTSRSKVVDPETGSPQLVGHEGLLLGWYVTGDVAKVVEERFIFLTGRLSRSSKIAGEMVPHGRVEEAIEACVDEGEKVCVIANPDEDRGEKLIALYEGYALDPAELAHSPPATSPNSGSPNETLYSPSTPPRPRHRQARSPPSPRNRGRT